jgi:hypothetical protein
MAPRRQIDERDVDRLLASLTDTQIANLFDMTECEVSDLRLSRQRKLTSSGQEQNKTIKRKSRKFISKRYNCVTVIVTVSLQMRALGTFV